MFRRILISTRRTGSAAEHTGHSPQIRFPRSVGKTVAHPARDGKTHGEGYYDWIIRKRKLRTENYVAQ
ncbi:hypothetical protein HMPREF1631_04240 [Arcanobacterium sp. S3PF19]|nr:hypothetical protein HMPREF1631_04240 [Arcanobacterium sp. S3PF19]